MPSSVAEKSRILEQVDARLAGAIGAVCVLVLIVKLWLVTRININWDEFFFLSEIHALARGDLSSSFQTAYTRLFGWLTGLGEHEVARINVARIVMLAALASTAWMLYRLARRWYGAPAAALGVLAFLGCWAAMRHGASFRVDSLLLPLQIGALLALTKREWTLTKRSAVSGALLGIACVLSIKTVLIAPVVAVLLLLPSAASGEATRPLADRLFAIARLALVAALVAMPILAAHHFALPSRNAGLAPAGLHAQSVTQRGADAWRRTIGEAEFLPRAAVLREQVGNDPPFWLLAIAGFAVAVWRSQWGAAALSLAILPVLFYRNAFAYYYVVMLAPLAVLVAASVDSVLTGIRRIAPDRMAILTAAVLALGVSVQAVSHGLRLAVPGQIDQARLVSGVHAMFPEPVAYLDHSGMISSFQKANLFMTTWGMERYAADAKGFVRDALTLRRAPLLIENRSELRVGSTRYGLLRAEDRALIERFYLHYWGPVRVAGVQEPIAAGIRQRIAVPFPGKWRLRSQQAMSIDGRRIASGEEFTVGDAAIASDAFPFVNIALPDDHPLQCAVFDVIWAAAGQPPPGPVPRAILYDRL